jgi:dihydroorotate dehydrogenase electron transfer subunit
MKTGGTEAGTAGEHTSVVIENVRLNDRYFLLVLSRPPGFADPLPGNFVHVAIPGSARFFLRRPFSILDCTDERISLLVLEKGEGTGILRRSKPGDEIDFMGPLGNSFPLLPGKRIMAVGGGVGLAPLYMYGRFDHGAAEYKLIFGARSKEDLFLDRLALDDMCFEAATEDGSHGFQGNVVELAARSLEVNPPEAVFSCGPPGMLKALARLLDGAGMTHYVSLENRMACGIGVCRSCVIRIRSGEGVVNRTVCKDGPVFPADLILWDELAAP